MGRTTTNGDLPTMTKDELRAAREEMGLSQEQAARALGVSLSGYKKWELGIANISGTAVILTNRILKEFRVERKNSETS
jgi:DNA-binding transcriptional regulator YiaG